MLGVQHLVYHSVNGSGGQTASLTYCEGWVDRYVTSDYHRIDPVVLACHRRVAPLCWTTLEWDGRRERTLLGEAADFDIGARGYSIPLRGPGGHFAILTVNDSCSTAQWQSFTAEHAATLMLLAHHINHASLELAGAAQTEEACRLSPREADALTLLATGCSRAQAADRLAISEHTLRVYIEGARHKLGASNTLHAVVCAVKQGLIAP